MAEPRSLTVTGNLTPARHEDLTDRKGDHKMTDTKTARPTPGPWRILARNRILRDRKQPGFDVQQHAEDGLGDFICEKATEADAALIAASPEMSDLLAEALQTIICDNIKLADVDQRPSQYAGRSAAAKTAARISRLLARARPDKADFYNGTADAQAHKAAELDAKTAEWKAKTA